MKKKLTKDEQIRRFKLEIECLESELKECYEYKNKSSFKFKKMNDNGLNGTALDHYIYKIEGDLAPHRGGKITEGRLFAYIEITRILLRDKKRKVSSAVNHYNKKAAKKIDSAAYYYFRDKKNIIFDEVVKLLDQGLSTEKILERIKK